MLLFINAGLIIQAQLPVDDTDRALTTLNCPVNLKSSTITPLKVDKALPDKKSAGPDQIDSCFLKTAAGLIAEPIASIFNLSQSCAAVFVDLSKAFDSVNYYNRSQNSQFGSCHSF